jgi:peptide/nickel transport system substrate-binding protein
VGPVHLRADRRPTLLPLVLGGILLLAGCSEWGDAAGPKSGGTMTVTLPSLPSTWAPDSATGDQSSQPVRDVEAPLLQLTPNTQQAAPGLARTWKYDGSRTHLTLTLRAKAEFSNGHVVTAKDVVFSVDQWLKGPEHGAFYSGLISKVTAHGTHEVVFTLPAPSADMVGALSLTSSAIVPKDFGGRSAADFYARPIGAGPFAISSTSSSAIDLKPNKHFYDVTHPFLGHLDYQLSTDPKTALQQVGAGKADLVEGVPASELTSGYKHAHLLTTASQSTSVLTFSSKSSPTKDPQLRRAVSLAIDRSALVRSVYDGKAKTAHGLLPGALPSAQGCASCDWSQHDVALAERDLSSVPGQRHLTLLVDSTDPDDVATAQAITPMLAEAGITVQTQPVDPASMLARVSSGSYQMALQTLSAQTPSAADPLRTLATGHYLAAPGAVTAAASALRAVEAATKQDDATAAVSVFEQQNFTTTAAVPLVDPEVVDVVATSVRGLAISPSGLYHSSALWLKP